MKRQKNIGSEKPLAIGTGVEVCEDHTQDTVGFNLRFVEDKKD
jgi:hypothetical protein